MKLSPPLFRGWVLLITKVYKMGLKKGNTNNPNGRPKGSKNKVTVEVREVFKSLLEENINQIQKDIESLTPKERVNVLLKISEFVIPKLRSIDSEGKLSGENYKEYVKLKAEHDRLEQMTEEELNEELNRLEKLTS